jgi:hypothetical protein
MVSCRHSSHAQDAQPPIISTISRLGAAPSARPCNTAEPSAIVAQVRLPHMLSVEANTAI